MKSNSKTNTFIFILLGAVLLGGLFYAFKPKEQATSNAIPSKQQQTQQSPVPTEVSNKKAFDLVIENKQITSGEQTLAVNQGDAVTITVMSDEAEELHIHGYDNSVELVPNEKATLSFTADVSGRFPFELEQSGTEIGVIEVQPK